MMYPLLLAVTLLASSANATFCIDLFKGPSSQSPPYAFMSDGTVTTTIQPTTLKEYKNLERSITAYELFQKAIYKERLPKFRDPALSKTASHEPPKTIRPPVDYRSRSIYILNTRGTVDAAYPLFRGGIRIVLARRSEDKLPFEIDMGHSRHRRDGSAAEVGRFTVDESGGDKLKNAERSVGLIRAALLEIAAHKDVQTIYVHTSRTHVRLYKMMGLKPLDVVGEDPLNRIMIFTRAQLLEYLKPQAIKELTVAHQPTTNRTTQPSANASGF